MTLSRISSSLPRLRPEVAINSDRSQFLPHRCEERHRRFLPPFRSQEAGSREFSKPSAGSRGEATRNRIHTAPSDRRLSLARSPSLSPSLHSIRFITAKPRFPWTRNFSRTGKSSHLSNYPTKKRSSCYRDALHQLPARFYTALQFKAPTDCNRTSPRLWIHWPLPFSPRLDGAGPVPRFSPIH